jgi:hypothetical protein
MGWEQEVFVVAGVAVHEIFVPSWLQEKSSALLVEFPWVVGMSVAEKRFFGDILKTFGNLQCGPRYN